MFTFHDLVAPFEKSRAPELPVEMRQISRAALTVRQAILNPRAPHFFVAPDLEVENGPSLSEPFWLISAPAAVGKSTLAIALADSISTTGRDVLYIPLRGTTHIGRDWFGGLLSAVFDGASRQQQQAAVQGTRLVVFLDGYDELSLSDTQIEAHRLLISELVDYIGSSHTSRSVPSIVILFRAAIRGVGIFEPLVGHSIELRLEYFNESKQISFLSSYLASRGFPLGAETLLTELRQALLGGWAGQREAEQLVRSFLGHAPVLRAIGDLILESGEDVANPAHLVHQLKVNIKTPDWGAVLLLRLLNELVNRETGKFPDLFSAQGVSDVPTGLAYSATYQNAILRSLAMRSLEGLEDWKSVVVRTARDHYRDVIVPESPTLSVLDSENQREREEQYVREVVVKLEGHPFLDVTSRGITFSNPLYFERYLADQLFEGFVEPFRLFGQYSHPSHFLGEFLLQRSPNRDISGRADLLFYVMRSLLMAGGDDARLDVVFDGEKWECSVGDEDGDARLSRFICGSGVLYIEVPSGEILENIDIDGGGAGAVILAAGGKDPSSRRLALSKASIINANEILIDASHLVVGAVSFGGTRIHFSEFLAQIDGLPTLAMDGRVDVSDYLRRRYPAGFEGGLVPESDDEAFRRKLNGMLVWFRKRGKSTFAVFYKRWHTAVLKKDSDILAVNIAEFLKSAGILREDRGEGMVFLDDEVLARYGVHYKKQNEVSFGERFQTLVTEWKKYQASAERD